MGDPDTGSQSLKTTMDSLAALHAPLRYAPAPRLSWRTVLCIAAAHAGVFALLASLQVVPLPTAMQTLTVNLLTPAAPQPEVAPPKPQPRPAEAKPVARRPAAPKPTAQPVIAAPVEAAAVTEAPVVREAPTAPPAQSPAAPPAPVAASQPRFDADYLANPAPAYPPISRRLGEEGKVVLRVHVDADGRPAQVEVRTGSGSPRLDQAALDAVRRWRFVPAKRGDDPVAAWVLVPIVFKLKN